MSYSRKEWLSSLAAACASSVKTVVNHGSGCGLQIRGGRQHPPTASRASAGLGSARRPRCDDAAFCSCESETCSYTRVGTLSILALDEVLDARQRGHLGGPVAGLRVSLGELLEYALIRYGNDLLLRVSSGAR